jgi:hypothetical protein
MTNDRWSDDFLDSLRAQGDPQADDAVRRILADAEEGAIRTLFRDMDSNDAVPPHSLFPAASDFFDATRDLPPGTDLTRIRRGEALFWRHAYLIALVLLAKSLPEGYAAPNLAIILNLSGDLRVKTYRRLLGTLQMVLNVASCTGFSPGGRAVITAQKLRLLHAGVRYATRRARPDFESRFGVPVNQEDMLGTVIGFSYLVLQGLRTLGAGLTASDEEDFFYTWRVFAHMMGIHPAGDAASMDHLPDAVEDAGRFYARYAQRHYVPAARNPDGVALGRAVRDMLRTMIPFPLRLVGFGVLPTIAMVDLMGADACARIGITPVPGHRILRWALVGVHRLFTPLEQAGGDHHRIARIIFQDMIGRSLGGEVTFTVPDSIDAMRAMVPGGSSAHHRIPTEAR